jgi:hypothetical protein
MGGGIKGDRRIMFRYAGRYMLVVTFLYMVIAGLVSCDNVYSDGVFNYTVPESESDISSLIPIPIRREYFVNSEFKKEDDLSVIAVYPNGETEPIPVSRISVSIVEGDQEMPSTAYIFKNTGEKIVALSYARQRARYAVWVREPTTDTPTPTTPDTGDGGTVIIINIIP